MPKSTELTTKAVPKTSSYYVFTLNNPLVSAEELAEVFAAHPQFKFLAFQKEKAPDTGTVHYQGYVGFKRAVRFSIPKSLLPTAHWEIKKGTHRQALDYNTLEFYKGKPKGRIAGPWLSGTFPPLDQRPGKRNDIQAVVDSIKTATSFRQVVTEHTGLYIKYHKGIEKAWQWLGTSLAAKVTPRVYLFFGLTGTGKTDYSLASSKTTFKKDGCDPWFDGYTDQQVLVFDDFSGARSKMPLTSVLNYIDKYPTMLPVKGSFVPRQCSRIVVTTNIHPGLWYDYRNRKANYDALMRRFQATLYFTKKGVYQVPKQRFFDAGRNQEEAYDDSEAEREIYKAMDKLVEDHKPHPIYDADGELVKKWMSPKRTTFVQTSIKEIESHSSEEEELKLPVERKLLKRKADEISRKKEKNKPRKRVVKKKHAKFFNAIVDSAEQAQDPILLGNPIDSDLEQSESSEGSNDSFDTMWERAKAKDKARSKR